MEARLVKFAVPLGSSLLEAIEAIKNNRSRCVVITEGEKVVGVLSEGDIMAALLRNTNIHAQIDGFIHYDFKFLTERDLTKALNLMRQFGLTLVPVVDADFAFVDAITIVDVLNALSVGDAT